MGAKKFTLQAVDGPLSCLFWEIVRNVNSITLLLVFTGHLHCIIGLQDTSLIDTWSPV